MLFVKTAFFSMFVLPAVLLMLLHSFYYISSDRYRGLRSQGTARKPVSIVVPAKGEPEELVVGLVRHVGSLGEDYELVIVSDDPLEKALRLRELCEAAARPLKLKLKFVIGDPVKGSRTKALNRGVSEALYENVLIMDIDARPGEGFIDRLVECVESGYDACVGRWEAYYNVGTVLAHTIGAAMRYTVDAIYKGRSALGLFTFPLGSGTLFRKVALMKVGLWDEVIQDDMHIGVKFLSSGLRIRYVDDVTIRVIVPSTYTALRIQQGRWAYGAIEALKKLFRTPVRARVGTHVRLEAAVFLGQYVPAVMLFIGSLVTPLTSLATRNDMLNLGLAGFAAVLAPMTLYAITMYRSIMPLYGSRVRAIRTLGSSAAITLTLLPVISANTIRSLLGLKAGYRITPKGSSELSLINSKYLPELAYLAYLLLVSALNLVFGNVFTALWCLTFASAVVYTLLRAGKVVRPGSGPSGTT